MRNKTAWTLSALAASLLLSGVAHAQFGLGGYQPRDPEDTGRRSYQIKRRSVSGVIKSIDTEKRALTLTLALNKGDVKKDVPIDMSAGLIKAGNGGATLADLKVGDLLSIYGETDVHGGLRAMVTKAPASRISIKPPTKEERRAQREKERAAEREARAAEKAEKEAAKMAKGDAAASGGSDKPKKGKASKKKSVDSAQPDTSAQPSGEKQ